MAELMNEYLADTLNSRQLLALLFICECNRKKALEALSFDAEVKPTAWSEFLDQFAARLARLPEEERIYLLCSHLQSAEEIDIYSNTVIQSLLESQDKIFSRLMKELDQDLRFSSPS